MHDGAMRSKECLVKGFLLSLALWFLPQHVVSAANHTLLVNIEGSGHVTRNPTNSVYPEGSVVTVTALASNGWYFAEWTGDESGIANPLNVLISSNKAITAVFSLNPSYTLTLSTQGMGAITVSPPTGGPYLSNSIVTLTATAKDGWIFAGWTGDSTGSTNPLELTMTSDQSVGAMFAQLPVFDVSPLNATVELGGTVSFTAHALGASPLFYQWWFGSTRLSGEVSETLTLQNVQLDQEGIYSVVASNSYGSVTNSASLTITSGCEGTNVVSVATEAALREAIARGGLVRLCFNGTIVLGNTISVAKDVILDARNRNVVISGNDAVRLFSVLPDVTFGATNVVFANGRHTGEAGVVVEQVPIPGSPGEGGAFFCDRGTIKLTSCILSNNTASGGKAAPEGAAGPGRGGAIFVRDGSVWIHNSMVLSNTAEGGVMHSFEPFASPASGDALGGAVYLANSTAFVQGCYVASNMCIAPPSFNRASAKGGGVFLESGILTITNTHLVSNAATGIQAPVTISGFARPGNAYGGALGLASGTAIVSHCWVTNNLASGGNAFRHSGTGDGHGGAIHSTATLRVGKTIFAGNRALAGDYSSENADGRGGAVYSLGPASFERCAFIANAAVGADSGSFGSPGASYPAGHGLGGAVYNAGELNLTNTTIALNSAEGGASSFTPGYGSAGSGLGGGLYSTNGSVYTCNATIASNFVIGGRTFSTNGLADGANVANAGGVLTVARTILAYPGTNNNAWGTITDAGYNISSDGSAGFNSGASFNFTDPRLLEAAENGGPTPTMALQTNSPAIDLAPTAGSPMTDQRGLPRPSGSGVDAGAYEFQVVESRPSLLLSARQDGLRLRFTAQPETTYELQSSITLSNWVELEVIGPFGSETQVERTVTPQEPSTFYRLLAR